MNTDESLNPDSTAWRSPRWRGRGGAGALRGGAFASPTQFFRSYLLAFVFWVGVPLGCSAILMLHHLVGGRGVSRFAAAWNPGRRTST